MKKDIYTDQVIDEENYSYFVVCWTENDAEHWEVIDGWDAAQERISDLVESGIDEEEIVFAETIN